MTIFVSIPVEGKCVSFQYKVDGGYGINLHGVSMTLPEFIIRVNNIPVSGQLVRWLSFKEPTVWKQIVPSKADLQDSATRHQQYSSVVQPQHHKRYQKSVRLPRLSRRLVQSKKTATYTLTTTRHEPATRIHYINIHNHQWN